MAIPFRLFWLLVLALHAVVASAWWWLTPGGFPVSHPRFWSHRVAPLVVLAVVVVAVVAARRHRYGLLLNALLAFPVAWAAAALSCRVVFPITFGRLFAIPLVGAALMGAAVLSLSRRHEHSPRWPVIVIGAVAALFGASLPLAHRPPAPDTRPLNVAMPEIAAGRGDPPPAAGGRVSPRLYIHPGDGSLTVKAGALTLALQPLLQFLSRSPDGCLTLLAPSALREVTELRMKSSSQDAGRAEIRYGADYEAVLAVDPGPDEGPVVLEATARLPRPIYSHLNSFCDLEVSGHRRLSLSFSPCRGRRFEVRPFDYPTGRPLRLAYRDAEGWFRVVEASSGEKGPFRELAKGRLGRSDPLAMTLHDGETAVARVVLDDWASQTGTAPSPTAGWGLPVNAIEFSLGGDAPGSPAGIYFTLAGTSVGRGWDSVGHRAGTYRNRMRVESLGSAQR